MKAPTNTTKQTQEYPEGFLQVAMTVGTGNAIEIQEARGQTEFVNSETLPTQMGREDQQALEQAGFKFLGAVPGDPIFQYVEMPAGWKKVATDHAMWSNLVDDKGRVRASIFYKAAFYDRDAFLRLN